MLLAVEGGGFFSASASGYSKGLTLLLLGQRNQDDDKPMRVTPWNHYQLVEQESDSSDLQLASAAKNRLSRGCASFVCFGRASAGPDTPSSHHLKVGPAQNQDVLPGPLVADKKNDCMVELEDDNGNLVKLSIKSSLKRPSRSCASVPVENVREHEALDDEVGDNPDNERRKVQWTDACGSELVEIREFEPSETGESDDEFENGSERTCSCTIM